MIGDTDEAPSYQALEEAFIKDSSSDTSCIVLTGTGPLLLSAPHTVQHFRNGIAKQRESMTGVLVKLLHETTHCHGIIRTGTTHDDPNFDLLHPYKDTAAEIIEQYHIAYLLDLHIMSQERAQEIELGTGYGENIFNNPRILEISKNVFTRHAFSPLFVDELFPAAFRGTVSSSLAQRTSVASLQIEINWRIINPASPSNKIAQLLRAFTEIITELSVQKLHE